MNYPQEWHPKNWKPRHPIVDVALALVFGLGLDFKSPDIRSWHPRGGERDYKPRNVTKMPKARKMMTRPKHNTANRSKRFLRLSSCSFRRIRKSSSCSLMTIPGLDASGYLTLPGLAKARDQDAFIASK